MDDSIMILAILFLGWVLFNVWATNLSNSVILKNNLYESDGRLFNKMGFSKKFISSAIERVADEASKQALRKSLKLFNVSYLFLLTFLLYFFLS